MPVHTAPQLSCMRDESNACSASFRTKTRHKYSSIASFDCYRATVVTVSYLHALSIQNIRRCVRRFRIRGARMSNIYPSATRSASLYTHYDAVLHRSQRGCCARTKSGAKAGDTLHCGNRICFGISQLRLGYCMAHRIGGSQ